MEDIDMKEEIRNLTIEEFWEKYSKEYDNEKYETDSAYWIITQMYIGDFYEDGFDRDILIYSNYKCFEISKIEYFDEGGEYDGYNYSVCAMCEGNSVEYHPGTKMSDVFDAIYDEVKEGHLEMFNALKSYIEDEEDECLLSREFDLLEMDFIELYADKLGIEYYYDEYWNMHITKIEKVWI